MIIGMVGLGRMGSDMGRRLARHKLTSMKEYVATSRDNPSSISAC